MRATEYRELISDLSAAVASLKSAADYGELEREATSAQRKRDALASASCPRATARDRAKASLLLESARQTICSALMAVHDNQRIEAEYSGEDYPFVNPLGLT